MEIVNSESSYIIALNKACFFKITPNSNDAYGATGDIEEATRFSGLGAMYRCETVGDIAKKLNGKIKKMTTKVVLEDVE